MEGQTRCLECGEHLKGRVDKKFCSDACRNSANNRQKQRTPYMREVESVLKQNRHVLRELLRENEGIFHRRVNRSEMVERGFDFEFFTNVVFTGKSEYVLFCYEYGFMQQSRDMYLITRKSEVGMPSAN
jgi:predicted nucleic acid-binding Zn ribbon protein